jgi:antitoxin YefM
MDAISYSGARQNLAKLMDKVCDEHEPIIVTRKSTKSIVMMSLEDFNSIQETTYLLKSKKNAMRLRESVKQFEIGKCKERVLSK